MIDLSASIADVMESSVVFAQGGTVRPEVLKESGLIVSDLPVGYYQMMRLHGISGSELQRPYMPILMMEQAHKIPEASKGSHLFSSKQPLDEPSGDLLKAWLTKPKFLPC